MGDEEEDGYEVTEEDDPQEAMLARHRRESKELQAQVMTLKAGIPKGDKKRKKAVAAEIARLEGDLAERHTAELLEGLTVVEEEKQETQKEEVGVAEAGSGAGRPCVQGPEATREES